MNTSRKAFRRLFGVILSLLLLFTLSATPALAATSQIIYQGSTSNKVVALTFDDGSDGYNIQSILNTLSANNIKATFFLTGQGAENHPQAIKNIVSAGHDIGNHSYNHPDFTTVATTEMTNQLTRTETIITNLTGKSTKPFFRAPFGSYNSTVLQTVGNAGYTYTFQWTIDSLDWTGNSATDIYNRVINNIVPGAIVLMHTGYGANGTTAALPNIINQLRAMGYSFVTLSQLMNTTSTPGTGTGTSYTVKAGDTLYAIALRYGVTVQAIVNANGLTNANLIRVESITLFWSPWGSKDSGCSKIKIAKVKACCYSTFTLAIYCFMDFATNVKKKEKAPHTAEIAVKYSHYKILRRSLFL